MGEHEHRVRSYRVDYRCECGEQDMKWGGVTQTSNPPSYPHHCLCGRRKTLRHNYPYTVTRYVYPKWMRELKLKILERYWND